MKMGFANHMLSAHGIDPADPSFDKLVLEAKEAMSEHDKSATSQETVQDEPRNPPAPTAPASAPPAKRKESGAPKGIDPAKIKDPAARERYIQAIQIQEDRAEAPDAFVADMTRDPLKSLVARYAPECVGKNAPWHAFFGRVGEEASDASLGYISVFDKQGVHVRHRDVVLYKIPMAQYRAKVKFDGDESVKILSETFDDGQEEAKADPRLAAALDVDKSVRRGRLDE